jgi:hypothetical protein
MMAIAYVYKYISTNATKESDLLEVIILFC